MIGSAQWRPLLALVGGSVLLYLPLVGYRWDYLAHFVIGAGLALTLMAIALLVGVDLHAAGAVAVTAVLVGSILGEHWWFGQLVFDWADVGSGGLGAASATVGGMTARPRIRRRTVLLIGVALTAAGLALRYGTDST